MTFKLRAPKFQQRLARGTSKAQRSGVLYSRQRYRGSEGHGGLTHVPESRNRKASGTGGANEDGVGVSWESAGPHLAGLCGWGRADEFYFMCKRSSCDRWAMISGVRLRAVLGTERTRMTIAQGDNCSHYYVWTILCSLSFNIIGRICSYLSK